MALIVKLPKSALARLMLLYLLTISLSCIVAPSSVFASAFEDASRSHFNEIPQELPSNTFSKNSDGTSIDDPTHHTYFVLSKDKTIDNVPVDRGLIIDEISDCTNIDGSVCTLPRDNITAWNSARVVLYTTNPNISVPNIYINYVSRAVNFGGSVEQKSLCAARLSVKYKRNVGGASKSKIVDSEPNKNCGSKPVKLEDDEAGHPLLWEEIRDKDTKGNYVGRKVYKLQLTIWISAANSDTQSSFSLNVNNPELRLGYDGGDRAFNSVYGSALEDQVHSFEFRWRAPCNEKASTSFYFDDGQEGQSQQTRDAVGNSYRNGSSSSPTVNTFTTSTLSYPDSNTTSGVAKNVRLKFDNINGGNGFGIRLSVDSGRYYFKTCPGNSGGNNNIVFECNNGNPRVRPVGSPDTTKPSGSDGKNKYFMGSTDVGINSGGSAATSDGIKAMKGGIAPGYTEWDWWYLTDGNVRNLMDGYHDLHFYYDYYSTLVTPPDFSEHPVGPDSGNNGFTIYADQEKTNCFDDPPTGSPAGAITATCTTASYHSVDDADDDSSGNMQIIIRRYERNSSGNATGDYTDQVITIDQGSSGTVNLGKIEYGSNDGIVIQLFARNVLTNGTWSNPADWRQLGGNYGVGSCYSATCNLQIMGGIVPGGASNQVMAGSTVTVQANITNNNAADRAPLYDEIGGSQLYLANAGSSASFGAVDWLWTNESIGIGSTSGPRTFTFTAPNSRGDYSISAKVTYNGRFDIGNCPTFNYKTYQPYEINPQANITETQPDSENPNYIKYSYNATRKTNAKNGPYAAGVSWYEGSIGSYTQTRLYYKQSGGAEKGPSFYASNSTDPVIFNTADSAIQYGEWTDSLPDVRQFNHGGVTDSWVRGDQYCPYYRVQNGFGWQGPGSEQIQQAERVANNGCGTVTDRPFVRVYGGDILNGAKLPGGNPGSGAAIGYARGSEDGAAYAGSGTQFAILASGNVGGLASAMLRLSAPVAPTHLTFSNSTLYDAKYYGRGFGSDSIPMDDWYEATRMPETEQASSPGSIKASSLDEGKQYWYDGNLTLTADTDYSGRRTIYVAGDVTIDGNIQYTNSARTDINKIPSLVIIAKGNININPSIDRIDGIYVAQPKDTGTGKNNDTATGRIYTCKTSDSAATSAFASTCGDKKLKVNGALVAQDIRFLRTKGTLKDVTVTQATEKTPGVPPTGGFVKDSVRWRASNADGPACATKSITLVEPSDPNWNNGNGGNDNQLCYNASFNLQWFHAGKGSNTNCVGLNNPLEYASSSAIGMVLKKLGLTRPGMIVGVTGITGSPDPHTWGDNFICSSSPDAGLDMKFTSGATGKPSVGSGKDCVNIYEVDWMNAENGKDPWGTNKAWLCYNVASGGTPEAITKPVQYARETFENDHAAESIRMTPEVFLAQHILQPIGSQSNGKFDYIEVGPPVMTTAP